MKSKVLSGELKHTPTPWNNLFWQPHKIVKDGKDIAMTIGDNPESTANASFIVKAVNNHSDLLDALKSAVAFIDQHECAIGLGEARTQKSLLREYIAKAEGR